MPSPALPQKRKQNTLQLGSVVKTRWKVLHQIGRGAFGETYSCRDLHTNQDVAIKVESLQQKKMVLKLEVIALKKLQPCSYVVRYIHSGRENDYNFLVMERLGANLAELRKKMPGQKFSMCTSLRLVIQMIEGLEGIHKLSHVHRDVKPSNFVVGRHSRKNYIYVIDFGLARKYRLPSGEIRPPRKHAGFRGTARYASVNSHKCRELGRRDDLWSVFYVLVEFTKGHLPWRKLKSKEQIGEVKEQSTNVSLVKDLPDEFRLFMEHLQSLGYADEPDYQYLRDLLKDIMVREGYSMDTPFDWDLMAGSGPPMSPSVTVKQVGSIIDPKSTLSGQNGVALTPTRTGSQNAVGGDYFNIFQQQDAQRNGDGAPGGESGAAGTGATGDGKLGRGNKNNAKYRTDGVMVEEGNKQARCCKCAIM
mmetsp:Transcript_10419/g.38693  ORF Transcript_10419/g.38693 Transcript_10419/m.38693 type:complete len:419 (+) Transcript_10419:491-1747(+)